MSESAENIPIRPEEPVQLLEKVWRLTCANPGVMTGPGTNTYLLGGGERWSIVDPGPASERHLRAMLAAAPGRIERILITHTHPDHSPGALALQAVTGAELIGRTSGHARGQDASFQPGRQPEDGDRLGLADGMTLRVLHTPGHAANHLCYLLEQERLLFTGDHVIHGSTVLIDPPDGDMSAYLASLERLLGEDLQYLAPGHGSLMPQPHAAVRALIRHRLRRESKVLTALRDSGPSGLAALVTRVYDDVPAERHALAERSLLAHLLKLEAEGRAFRRADEWRALP
jgi:glyoxylase-like metal-dependent hydrolase (beta-lactamase superfamily II)